MKHSLALLLCSWLVPTLMLGSCGSTRSVELVGGELAEVTSSFLAGLDAAQQKAAQRASESGSERDRRERESDDNDNDKMIMIRTNNCWRFRKIFWSSQNII